jgi:hypothetical protein
MDLNDPRHAYLYGFLQADGSLEEATRNRGKLRVEVAERDRGILEVFASLIPVRSTISTRTRTTNFKAGYSTAIWTVYDFGFRRMLQTLGLTPGRKSGVMDVPGVPFSQPDYFRGLIDADGALGLTGNGFPFLTLTTASERLATRYAEFVAGVIGKKKSTSRNTRDSVYNICVYKEDAQQLGVVLYYDGCLALPRKLLKAAEVRSWVRPTTMKRVENRRPWTDVEDQYVLTHTIEQAAAELGRSPRSVSMRRWRLRGR